MMSEAIGVSIQGLVGHAKIFGLLGKPLGDL